MVRILFVSLLLFAGACSAQYVSVCHVAGGVHIAPQSNPPKCVVGDEAGSGATGTHPAWIYSGLEFPHPPTSGDSSCMVVESVVPKGYTAGWTANLQMQMVRSTDGTPTDQVNFTGRATYLAANANFDIRSPIWSTPVSVDDLPNGSEQMTLWEPWVGTIHDLAVGTSPNAPGVRRNMAFLICRETGPTHVSPFTADGTDVNTGKVRVTSVNIRWEDASNVVQAETGFMPLASTSQEVSDDGLPIPVGPDTSVLGYLAGLKAVRLYINSPEELKIGPQSTGVCSIGGGTRPECGDGQYFNGTELLDGETDCAVFTTVVPEDVLIGSQVRMDAYFRPSGSSGNFAFQPSTAFTEQGADLSAAAQYTSDPQVVATSCAANSQQITTFDSINMTGALPGRAMTIRFCRIEGIDDTATSNVEILKLRIFWKRLVQIEQAPQ